MIPYKIDMRQRRMNIKRDEIAFNDKRVGCKSKMKISHCLSDCEMVSVVLKTF